MATREIKTRFALEGEQKFKSAMKESANAIKLLNAQEKLAKAQFQQTGDAEKYVASQTQLLKQKIEEQKGAVAAAEQAIKSLTDNGISPSSKQMQDWEMKLTNAQTALVKMETDLQNLGQESSEANSETEELSTTLQSLDKKANLEAIVNGMGKMTSALESAVAKAKELATELVNAMKDAAAWADDLATQAIIYGTDVETLQRMRNAADLIDTDVETIIKAKQKLESAMKSGSTETEQAFAQFGVHTKRYGEYRDWEDVFWETGDALMHMTDGLSGMSLSNAEIERDNAALKLFGKSWRELLPLFTAGREAYQKALEEQSVVSEEDVSRLTELDDAFQKLINEFETLQRTVLAQLAPALTDLSEALKDALKELNEYLASEEGQQKLAELREAVKSLFEGVKDIDFRGALDTAKGALDSIKSALEWVKNNKDGVIKAIEGIILAWGGMKLVGGAASIISTVTGIKGLLGKGGAGAGGASAASGSGTGTAGAAAGGGVATAASNWLTGKAASGAAFYASQGMLPGVVGDMFMNQTNAGRALRDGGGIQGAIDGLQQDISEKTSEIQRNASTFFDDWSNLFKTIFGGSDEGGGGGSHGFEVREDNIEKVRDLQNQVEQEDAENASAADARNRKRIQAIHALEDLQNQVSEEDAVNASEWETDGANAVIGLANGINANASIAIAAAKALAAAVTAALSSALKIHSPSRVMAELGGYVSQGFAEGITSGLGVVNQAAESMARAVTNGVSDVNAGAGINGSGSGRMIDITLMLGPEQLTSVLVPLVDNAMGEEINLMRR